MLKPLYNFEHIADDNENIPKLLPYSFDARYSCMMTPCEKYLETIMSDSLINEIMMKSKIEKFTPYWCGLSKIKWSKIDDTHYESQVICMKSKTMGKTVGFNIREEWELRDDGNQVVSIREI